jgi:hypothetical protein
MNQKGCKGSLNSFSSGEDESEVVRLIPRFYGTVEIEVASTRIPQIEELSLSLSRARSSF